jgi:hypothetical protein
MCEYFLVSVTVPLSITDWVSFNEKRFILLIVLEVQAKGLHLMMTFLLAESQCSSGHHMVKNRE